jgi:DNA-directed RNA polymerase I, II, and III subunit RPABC2/DNA-directed RNA polymerase subunit K
MSQPDEPEFPDNEEIIMPGDEELAQQYTYPENVDLIDDDSDDDLTYERSSTPTEDDVDDVDADDADDADAADDAEDNLTDNQVMNPTPLLPGINPALYEDEEDKTDEENEDSDDEDNLKKLERDIDNDKLIESHPEIIQNNYNEILALCNIVRNDKGVIVDDLHRTYPFISKYEYARIVGIRAKQINNGADPFIKVARGVIDGFTIAKLEMNAKKVPFIIARPLPNGSREYWKVQDLEMIHF